MDTALKKRHGWAARWEWLNLNKGYTSIDTAGLRIGLRTKQTKPRTCKASRNHEVPCIISMRIQAVSLKKQWISVPKKSVIITISLDIKKICVNL